MSLYFDGKKQLFRIRIRKAGQQIARALPKGTTEETARAIHAQLINDVHRVAARTGEVPGWRETVEAGLVKGGWALDMLARCERRSKAAQRPCRLTPDDLRFLALRSGGRCEVTGIPFSGRQTDSRRRPFFQSIDRKDCAQGYTIENCRLVCLAVNIAMSNWGEDVVCQMATGLIINRFSPPWLEWKDLKITHA